MDRAFTSKSDGSDSKLNDCGNKPFVAPCAPDAPSRIIRESAGLTGAADEAVSYSELCRTCRNLVWQIDKSCDSLRLHRKRKLHDMHILLSVSPMFIARDHERRNLDDASPASSPTHSDHPPLQKSVFYGDSYPFLDSPSPCIKDSVILDGHSFQSHSEMKGKFRRIIKKSKFGCAFPLGNESEDEVVDATGPQSALAQNEPTNHGGNMEHARHSQEHVAGSQSQFRNIAAPDPNDSVASPPEEGESLQVPQKSNGKSDQHSSRNSFGRRRAPDEVYKYVREIEGTNTFECKSCGKMLGKRHATRFKIHCVEKCTGLHTPIKRELQRRSKSRTIREPQQRSRIGLALQRDNASRSNDLLESFDDHDENQMKRTNDMRSSAGSRDSKKRKSLNVTPAHASSSSDPRAFVRAIMEFIIMKGLPFNIFDSHPGSESEAVKLFRCLKPGFSKSHVPSGKLLAGRELDYFHTEVQSQVKDRILSALRQGYGSLIFDGWDDVNSSPVVNVLLRTEGNIDAGRRIFFLSCVYTGSSSSGANEYVRILEDVMRPYGGFDRICAITSDNTSSCLNTRKMITEKYGGIVGVNDQSHVADLLMEDVGKLPWIKDVISQVSSIAKDIHNHRKLKARFKSLIGEYNEFVKSFHKTESGTRQPQSQREESVASSGWGGDRDPASLSGKKGIEPRTAIMLKQSSNTRFASSEGVLESFIRSLTVLRTLVQEEDFDALFKPKNLAARKKRDEEFVQYIEDQMFSESVRDVHRILVILRRYLRVFDGDNARISEVLPFTMEVEKRIEKLTTSEFLTAERKAEVLSVYRRRRDGPLNVSIRVRLLEDIHYVAHMLDPNLCPDEALSFIQRFRSHARLYALSVRAVDVDSMVNRLVLAYMSQREIWRRDRDGMTRASNLKLFHRNALLWWCAGNCQDAQLQEFAIRTLSCSPTSCAVERSFSAQKKLQPKERNRLSQEKIQKMIFCYWNLRLMRNMDMFDKQEFWESVGNALRALDPSYENYTSQGGDDDRVTGDESSDDDSHSPNEDDNVQANVQDTTEITPQSVPVIQSSTETTGLDISVSDAVSREKRV